MALEIKKWSIPYQASFNLLYEVSWNLELVYVFC